jgi:hypothetical protein
MMAGLDLWRAVQTGTAPKARNFGLNLIGLSIRATIDRWAARFLQRMHNPNWRLPPLIEGEVIGAHMAGEKVGLVSHDFGMGQDVFEDVATRLQGTVPEFKNLTPADLQAILWFAEKEYWELRSWTPIAGAQSSMNAMAEATSAQRYEAGVMPEGVTASQKKMASETMKFRTALHKDKSVIGGKIVPTVSLYKGEQLPTIDADWVTHPEHDPSESVSLLARTAASLGKAAAHISRVIVNPDEVNENATPGLHIFFKGRVSEKEIQPVVDELRKAGLDGVIFSVDPRVRPEIIKSLDPKVDPNQYSGVRIQHIPQYGTTGEIDSNKLKQIFRNVANKVLENANIADARVLLYDTLVLEKDTDYDTKGNITSDARDDRAGAWTQRALREGAEATARRDRAKLDIEDRQKRANDLQRRNEAEEQARLDELEAAARSQPAPERAIDGGVDPPSVAAMQYEDEQEPVRDPYGGRSSLVRAMVNRITNLGRNKAGLEIPESESEVRGIADLGGSTRKGGSGSAPIWQALGGTFRKREAALYQRLGAASKLVAAENPEADKYQVSQRFLDYLSGKEIPSDPELQAEIGELRKEIPTVSARTFAQLKDLDAGSEAFVQHDEDGGVVYKLYNVSNGKLGGYVPGQLSLRRDGEVVPAQGDPPTFMDFLERMERSNSHGLTPAEFAAVTPEGDTVFVQPFIAGRGVTPKNIRAALARAGIHLLSEMGGIAGIGRVDGRWVLFDDLHKGNVRTLPGGRIEIIDANNRELDSYEVADLTQLGKMPLEKPLGAPRERKRTQKYENAVVVAPMVETYHGTPHEWAPEVKVRFHDGREQWFFLSSVEKAGMPEGAKIVERAPAGRVRAEKVGAGEGHAAFGWGVLYSAQARDVAEGYRQRLSSEEGKWFIEGEPIEYYRSEEYEPLLQALTMVDTDRRLDAAIAETIEDFHKEADYREKRAAPRAAYPQVHLSTARSYRRMADALEKFRDRIEYRKGTGNVYTVQLDVNDPELLDWFKPMRDQMWVFDRVAGKYGVTREDAENAYKENELKAELVNNLEAYARRLETEPEATPGLREEIIKEHADAEKRWEAHFKQPATVLGRLLRRINSPTMNYTGEKFYLSLYAASTRPDGKRAASELLNSVGVPGIVFLDKFSRREMTSIWQHDESGAWMVSEPDPTKVTVTKVTPFETEEAARAYVAAMPRTNNYVMFDPEKIKVVAKNGEVVRTIADDLPAPAHPGNEPVSVAAMAEEEVKDGTDLSVAPMAGRGTRARYPWFWQEKPEKVAGYKPGGMWSPQAQLSRPVGYIMQEQKAEKAAIIAEAKYLVRGLEKAMKKGFGGKPTPAQLKDVQVALGNADNRLSQAQYQQALKEKDPAKREAFIQAEYLNSAAAFRVKQQAALASLPEVVRDSVIELRKKLDEQMQGLLHDPGIDVDLKARLSADQGIFLHTNSYQHFENDVWGKYISKSNDPKAQQIRRAAEDLFKNEVAAEMAQAYQAAQAKLGITVSDADALNHAYATGHVDQMAKTRLATYLRKDADEITRIHMLTGKMPVDRSEGGKLLSLQRESIPKEIRELWGQWDEPKANFVKTFSLLANHNAENRMQAKVLAEGTAQGYIWKRSTATTPLPSDLVALGKPGDHGPLSDAYGPQLLKDGMANYNHPSVRQLQTDLNRFALMSKTIGSIGSAIHNLLGNIAFTITSGNLPWAVVYMPKGFFVTLIKGMDGVLPITPSKNMREEQLEMIRLGIFDSDVNVEQVQEIYRAMEVAAELEKKIGTAGAIHGTLEMIAKLMGKEPVTGAAKWTGRAGKNFYMAMDNFWKYINYRTELSKQQWFNANNPTPPSAEEMKQRAARMVQDILPNRERVAEWVRRGVGSESLAGQFVGPFFTFPLEAGRTVVNNAYHTGRELFSPDTNAREKSFAAWRAAGMMLTLSAPVLISIISKLLNGYTDDDEEALRASLPSYRQNASFLIMMPRNENGVPQYYDVSFLNPYGYYHSSLIAAGRSYQEKSSSLPEAAKKWAFNLLQPLYTVQPGLGTIMDMSRNSDSLRSGAPIFNPEDSWDNISMKLAGRAVRAFGPGTAQNIYRSYLASQGYVEPKTGRALELGRELESLVGAPHLETLEMDKALASAVSNYKKRMNNAVQILNEKVGAKEGGTIRPGEVTAAYERANEQAFKIFSEMNKAYENLRQLGMKKQEAIKAMEIGFGTEIMKGGLGKNSIQNIIRGKFFPIQISDQMEKQARANGTYDEYRSVMREAEKRYVNP